MTLLRSIRHSERRASGVRDLPFLCKLESRKVFLHRLDPHHQTKTSRIGPFFKSLCFYSCLLDRHRGNFFDYLFYGRVVLAHEGIGASFLGQYAITAVIEN